MPGQKKSQSAVFLLQQIQSGAIDPTKMKTRQREICVRHLLLEYKYSHQEIAQIVGSVRETITRMKARILEQDGWMLSKIDERKIAVDMIQKAEMCFTRLVKKEKYKEAWNIEKEKIESLQSLGYLTRTPIEVEGRLTLLEILKRANTPHTDPAGSLLAQAQETNGHAGGNGRGVEAIHN